MGVFDWLFKKNEDSKESMKQKTIVPVSIPNITLTVKMERVDPPPVIFENFTANIAGIPVKAEVPIASKAECERLLKKKNRTDSENEFLHYNYWVNVYYRDERHGYHGINDVWTYSARDLPEFLLLYQWIYTILGKKKAKIDGNITTARSWEEKGTLYVSGNFASIGMQVSFKPRGFVLSFLLNDEARWEDKASFNTKTGQNDFPFYYSDAKAKIIEWGKQVYEENRVRSKGV